MPSRGRAKRGRKHPAGPPAVIIHSLAHAEAALKAAAECRTPIELWSAEGAAGYVGAGWFKAVLDEARGAVPGATFIGILDCADMPGYALAAFRIGLDAVCFTGPAKVAVKLDDISGQQGKRLLRRRPKEALDLIDSESPLEDCRAWLARR